MSEDVTHADLLESVNALTKEVAEMRVEMTQTRDMVQAWQAVKTGGAFITWAAKVLGGIVLMIALYRYGIAGPAKP